VLEGIDYANSNKVKVRSINPTNLDIKPCKACSGCYHDGHCVIEDDMQRLYKKFDRADIILVSTPVYFNGVTAQLKIMIDRCQALWASKYRATEPVIDTDKVRKGYLMVAGGAPSYPDQFLAVDKVIDMFFRVTNTDYIEMLSVANTDDNPVKERENILDRAYQVGQNIRSN
jgi:multimeric flavodoxin WrbA